MGTTKKAAKAKRPSKKAPVTKRATKTVDLVSLDAERYGRKPDVSVARQLHATKVLAEHAKKHAVPLCSGSKLERAQLDELPQRIVLLDRCETEWSALRKRTAPKDISRARAQGTTLRSIAIRALRYFAKDDAEVQAQLNAIQEGDGDVDLVDDLKKLGELVDEHADALAKAKKLPAERGDALRKSALELEAGLLDRDTSPEAREAVDRRNRAFWWLQDLVSEVRAAGQYVFEDEPAKFALYVDPLRRPSPPKKSDKPADAKKS